MENNSCGLGHVGLQGQGYQSWCASKRRAQGRDHIRRCRARKVDARNEADACNQTDPKSAQGEPLTLEHCQSRASKISTRLARELVQFASPLLRTLIQRSSSSQFRSSCHMLP
jgi:hypothetical protein